MYTQLELEAIDTIKQKVYFISEWLRSEGKDNTSQFVVIA